MLGLGLGLHRPSAPKPVPPLLDMNFAASQFALAGKTHANLGDLLAVSPGVQIGQGLLLGPYVAPDAPELLVNGDFSAGTSSWAAYTNGGIAAGLSVNAGELVVDGQGGPSNGFSQAVALGIGKAYRLTGSLRRGTTSTYSMELRLGASNIALNSAVAATLAHSSTTSATRSATGGAEAALSYVGARLNGTANVGTSIFDDLSLKEASPFTFWRSDGFSARISGRTPAAVGTGDKVLLQADHEDGAIAGSARNRVRVYWDNAKRLQVLVNQAGAVVAQLDLGVVETSTDFELLLSVSSNAFRAVLLGRGALQADLSGTMPGLAVLRIGRSIAGEAWDGTIDRVSISPALSEAEFYTALPGGQLIALWGDSLAGGINASAEQFRTAQAAGLLFNPPRAVISLGIGGQTSTQIAARTNAQPIAVTLAGNQIPASGPVSVTTKSINVLFNSGVFTGTQSGTLAGVSGTMSTDTSGNWSFTRRASGSAIACPANTPFLCDIGTALHSRTNWLWLGRNGAQAGYSVESDIAAVIASLGHDRYLVGAILTSTGDNAGVVSTIAARNAALATLYGARFVDLMGALQASGDGSVGDNADIAAGYVPRSKRSDVLHLNDAGYAIAAAAFKTRHEAMGW